MAAGDPRGPVLVFPLIAVGLHRRAALTPADLAMTAEDAEETPRT